MKQLLLASALLTFVSVNAFAQTVTTNLLTNPGAETGDLSGWTVEGTSNPTIDNGSFDPGISPHTGNFDFRGGRGASGILSQTVSLITQGVTTDLIDNGFVYANLSFWEQGLNQGMVSDQAGAQISFIDGSSAIIAPNDLGIYLDSHDGVWQTLPLGQIEWQVPVGARSIEYQMIFHRFEGSDLDAFIDDNSLTLTTRSTTLTSPLPPLFPSPPPVNPVSEPGTITLLATGLIGALTAARRRRRIVTGPACGRALRGGGAR